MVSDTDEGYIQKGDGRSVIIKYLNKIVMVIVQGFSKTCWGTHTEGERFRLPSKERRVGPKRDSREGA